MPNSITYITQIHHEPFLTLEQCTYVATFNELGKTLSVIPGGYVAMKMGRKKILAYVLSVNFISWIILCSGSSFYFISFARFWAGSSEGMYSIVGSIAVAELSYPKYRVIFSSLTAVAFNLGLLFEACLSNIFGSYKMLNITNAAISCCFLPTIFFFLESHYYLVHVHEDDKAENNLRKVRPSFSADQVRKEFEAIKKSVEGKVASHKHAEPLWKVLRQSSIKKALMCSILVTILPTICGNPQIRLFMTVIMPTNEFIPNSSYPLVCCVITFFGAFLSIWILKGFSRRLLSIISYMLICILHAANCVFCYLYATEGTAAWKWAFLAGNALFMGLQASTLSSLNDAIRAEVLPYAVKEVGYAACLILKSLTLISSYKLFIYIQESIGLYANYVFFVAISAISCVAMYAVLPETAGKSLTDVQNDFEAGNKKCDKVERY